MSDEAKKAAIEITIEYNGKSFQDWMDVTPYNLVDGVMDMMTGLEVEVKEEEARRMEIKRLLKEG